MIGIDCLEVERIDDSDKFLERIALPAEANYIKNCQAMRKQRTTALFCVKEAVMKALELGSGSGVVFKDIELYHLSNGKPEIKLYGIALERFNQNYSGRKIEVSISHSQTMATAIAIIV